ncbi:hypothetical protein C8N26_1949 [Tenacibaculum lutimaris]|uniref:TonB-dependent receptor-like protein n=1 Tax=Tenacibaculum lutimaris TaxID=285258 RepID=A0A420E0F6_9FLAO|nr:hypothetical protein [Tenacibaculum lutimaris]RKF03560.1 hypothetical protein C8N26_1949 [Tenacibaculum lutimaris]
MKKIISIIFVFLTQFTEAQQQEGSFKKNIEKFPSEKIYLHNNNDFLLTGDRLLYSIHCFNNLNRYSFYSKVAYIELIDKNNKSLVKQSISLKNGHGNGDIFINTNLETGTYKLVSYTQWMLNRSNVFSKDIFIVNPFSNKLSTTDSIVDMNNSNKLSDSLIIRTNIDNLITSSPKSSYSKREKVSLKLTNEFSKLKGHFSVSIRKKLNFSLPKNNTNNIYIKQKEKLYLPELRGTLIEGRLVSKSPNVSVSNINISLSHKNINLPISALTNKEGKFYFNINTPNTKNLLIQVHDKNKKHFKVIIDSKNHFKPNFDTFTNLYFNDSVIKTIQRRSIYSQIENAFFSVKGNKIINDLNKNTLLSNKGTTYLLDEYKRFKTVNETFIEVIPNAGFNRNGKNHELNILDPEAYKDLKLLPSLVIIDGFIIDNHEDLMNFDPNKIKSISIIKDKYLYGNAIYQGIAIVKTFKNNFNSQNTHTHLFQIEPIQHKKTYFFQDSINSNNKRIPDFRTQLFWNPNFNLKNKEIIFFTSDIVGEYEVNLKGYTNTGNFVSYKHSFFVN